MKRSMAIAVLVLVLGLVTTFVTAFRAQASSSEFTHARTIQISRAVEITMRESAQPESPLVLVAGVLTLHLNPVTGIFTGTITPGFEVAAGAPEGELLDAVLWRSVNGELVPDPEVTELEVAGQIQRQAVNVVVRDVFGPGGHIYGVGSTEHDPGRWVQNDPGAMAGPAVGPLPGLAGDWSVTYCVYQVDPFGRIVRQVCEQAEPLEEPPGYTNDTDGDGVVDAYDNCPGDPNCQ